MGCGIPCLAKDARHGAPPRKARAPIEGLRNPSLKSRPFRVCFPNPEGWAVESHVSQKTRDMGHPQRKTLAPLEWGTPADRAAVPANVTNVHLWSRRAADSSRAKVFSGSRPR